MKCISIDKIGVTKMETQEIHTDAFLLNVIVI